MARALAARRNVIIIDADELGHRALKQTEIKQKLRARFREAIFDPAGDVLRPALGSLVFGPEPEKQQARADLEAIVHPEIRKRFWEEMSEAASPGDVEGVILDAAVLLEAGWKDVCNAVVFIEAPRPQRVERVAARGWDSEELTRREASQWPLDEKRAATDFIVNNAGSLEDSGRELERILLTVRQSLP